MASSRWKRFAFFERNTLSIPSEVTNDLVSSGSSGARGAGSSSRRASIDSGDLLLSDSVCMAASTAALPVSIVQQQKPPTAAAQASNLAVNQGSSSKQDDDDALSAMWSTLSACTGPTTTMPNSEIVFPSQSESLQEDRAARTTTKAAVDGLVLLFCSSFDTDLIHCFDLTVRCDPNNVNTSHQDLDGWRGYFAPFGFREATVPKSKSTTIHAETSYAHLPESAIMEQNHPKPTTGIRDLAVCRDKTNDGPDHHRPLLLCCVSDTRLVLHVDPHLHLSCRLPLQTTTLSTTATASSPDAVAPAYTSWNTHQHGNASVMDMVWPGLVALGTEKRSTLVFALLQQQNQFQLVMQIPAPPSSSRTGSEVVSSVKLCVDSNNVVALFVSYGIGIYCFELGHMTNILSGKVTAPLARHDLDGRATVSSGLADVVSGKQEYMVAQTDSLYTYSVTQKVGVSPVDGAKLAMCVLPPWSRPSATKRERMFEDPQTSGSLYALVASKDGKSGRDAIDIYDATNKLVAFHVLLSPGHKALSAVGVAMPPLDSRRSSSRAGRSSAVVLTSGGSIVTLTEKTTKEKVSLLVQKNLYSAAISLAYGDPSYQPSDITALTRRHAEHLYRKGDYAAAMDQYILTIGSLESSAVIFRFLHASNISLLAKYLEELREQKLATPVHNQLLRACYLKLNDVAASERIEAELSAGDHNRDSLAATVSDLVTQNPKEAFLSVLSLDADKAAEAVAVHGASFARSMPHETAGLVVSLCVGTYSPRNLAGASPDNKSSLSRLLEYSPLFEDDSQRTSNPYPVHLFAPAFLDNPKLLRLILAHCSRNKCHLTPSFRRTLLDLTLAEWNHAKRTGDTETEKSRRKEAIASLTDSHAGDVGDYEALVLVQQAGFSEGELLLYERLQMTPMLLARYAQDGGERARRQMLAMCKSDPEVLADVLAYFVAMASEKTIKEDPVDDDSETSDGEANEILDDIREALSLARVQGVLPPVRIARILAGEGSGQFSSDVPKADCPNQRTVPLSVALDYVGVILDESSKEVARLRSEVDEYNQLCAAMETEIEKFSAPPTQTETTSTRINIDDIYGRLRSAMDDSTGSTSLDSTDAKESSEAFWRDLNHSEDRFETIARFFAKGLVQ